MKITFSAAILAYAISAFELNDVPQTFELAQADACTGMNCENLYETALAQINVALHAEQFFSDLELSDDAQSVPAFSDGFSDLLGEEDNGAQSAPTLLGGFSDFDLSSNDRGAQTDDDNDNGGFDSLSFSLGTSNLTAPT